MKNISRKLLSACVIVMLIAFPFVMTACNEVYTTKTYFAMDTVMEIKIAGSDDLLAKCGEIINALDKKLSVNDEKSLVYRLNLGEQISDDELLYLINTCRSVASSSEGAFDITVFPLVRSYGFIDKNYRVPDEDEIASILPKIGYEKISLSNGVIALPEGTEIDLGGIAKGYCSDLIRQYLVDNGVESGCINLGGNVTVIGKKNGKNWRVAIADPYDREKYIGILNVTDRSVVTSGLYERFFEKDGKKYGHIIDPKTGKTVNNGFLSVTVVGTDSILCDALSTALFVMGPEKAEKYVLDNGIEAIFLTDDGVIHVTEDLKDIELTGDYKNSVKAVISG